MGKCVRETLKERYKLILQTVQNTENRLSQMPEGRIIIRKIRGKTYYYHGNDASKDIYLTSKDTALIKALIQKSYLKEVLRSARRELKALEKMMKQYPDELPEEIFDRLPEERRNHAVPIIPGNEKNARMWMDEPYTKKPFKRGAPVFMTMRGERVRSKSEMIIADRLYANGIPYRYECPLKVGNMVIHPDFSMLRVSDGKVIYHEHCGMMDDPEYADEMVNRVNTYNQAGIIQGDRLTFSFESASAPLDVRLIDKLINGYFK
ncbi:MAG: hypothetical protein K5869_00800 [Saccharofermentans sp.]|nr:hypothetical protein [Saccharofermentans sp.]